MLFVHLPSRCSELLMPFEGSRFILAQSIDYGVSSIFLKELASMRSSSEQWENWTPRRPCCLSCREERVSVNFRQLSGEPLSIPTN